MKKCQNGRRFKENGDDAFTLTGQDKHGIMIHSRDNNTYSEEICGTLVSQGHAGSSRGFDVVVHNMMPRSSKSGKGGTGHLSKDDGTTYNIDTNTNTNTIEMGSQIRRLTPVECARLQGFPDDWCKDISESQAYRCYGNAVTVAITKLIFEKLYATEAKIKP